MKMQKFLLSVLGIAAQLSEHYSDEELQNIELVYYHNPEDNNPREINSLMLVIKEDGTPIITLQRMSLEGLKNIGYSIT